MTKRLASGRRVSMIAATIAAGALVFSACGGEFRAERQGKQFGEAVCDVKSADNRDDAQRQLDKAQRQAADLQRIVGRPLNEDVSDIQENLRDLVEHVANGNNALRQQDIAAIQRNLNAVARTLTGSAKAAYDGVQEGLAECDY